MAITLDGTNGVNLVTADALPFLAGQVCFFGMTTAPNGFLKCNGAAVSRTTYDVLFAAIGETFGVGDGSTTFNVPDLRGEFLRSLDDGAGIDTGRTLASAQSWAIENMTGSWHSGQHSAYDVTTGVFTSTNSSHRTYASGINAGSVHYFDASRQVNTSTETRPRNVALLACIKY